MARRNRGAKLLLVLALVARLFQGLQCLVGNSWPYGRAVPQVYSAVSAKALERKATRTGEAEGGRDDEMQKEVETLVTEGQPLLDRGLEEAKKFSEEEVLKWTAATLREDGVKAETIQEAVSMMRKARANGNQLLQQTVKDLVDVFHIPGGPATTLARRVQRLQAEKAPRYTKQSGTPTSSFSLCEFENGDFAVVREELLQNLTRFVKSCNNRRGICAINGLVKTGKTTVLTRLLPKIILQEFPDAEICVLTFTDFLTAHCEPDEMEERLRLQVYSWASKAIGLPAVGTETLSSLVDRLQESGRTIFFLIDEVQRFFEVQQGTIPKWDALKGFMCVSRERSNLHFVVTGSAMVLAWQNFLKMSPNGFTFSGECRSVFLPTKNEDAVIEYARNRFVQKGGEEVAELVQGITSVPLMAYTFFIWNVGKSIAVTKEDVSTKLMNEFVSEMTPLLQDPTWATEGNLKAVYELAWGKAPKSSPKSSTFVNERLFQCFFREYIIKTSSNTYGFMESPWTTCLRSCVSQEGKLLETSQQPVLQMFLAEQRLKDLATVGELVKGTLRRWGRLDPTERNTRKEVERICRQHNKSYGWPQVNDLNFQKVLGWHNGGINQSIQARRRYRMQGCTYLEMLRNANAHASSSSMTTAEYQELVMQCLPPMATVLVRALKNFTLSSR